MWKKQKQTGFSYPKARSTTKPKNSGEKKKSQSKQHIPVFLPHQQTKKSSRWACCLQ